MTTKADVGVALERRLDMDCLHQRHQQSQLSTIPDLQSAFPPQFPTRTCISNPKYAFPTQMCIFNLDVHFHINFKAEHAFPIPDMQIRLGCAFSTSDVHNRFTFDSDVLFYRNFPLPGVHFQLNSQFIRCAFPTRICIFSLGIHCQSECKINLELSSSTQP